MTRHSGEKIQNTEVGCKNSNIPPRCSKCGGMLIPEKAFSGDGDTLVTVSVGCVNCGERWFRAHQRRRPAGAELNAHLQAGRPAHLVPGGKRV